MIRRRKKSTGIMYGKKFRRALEEKEKKKREKEKSKLKAEEKKKIHDLKVLSKLRRKFIGIQDSLRRHGPRSIEWKIGNELQRNINLIEDKIGDIYKKRKKAEE